MNKQVGHSHPSPNPYKDNAGSLIKVKAKKPRDQPIRKTSSQNLERAITPIQFSRSHSRSNERKVSSKSIGAYVDSSRSPSPVKHRQQQLRSIYQYKRGQFTIHYKGEQKRAKTNAAAKKQEFNDSFYKKARAPKTGDTSSPPRQRLSPRKTDKLVSRQVNQQKAQPQTSKPLGRTTKLATKPVNGHGTATHFVSKIERDGAEYIQEITSFKISNDDNQLPSSSSASEMSYSRRFQFRIPISNLSDKRASQASSRRRHSRNPSLTNRQPSKRMNVTKFDSLSPDNPTMQNLGSSYSRRLDGNLRGGERSGSSRSGKHGPMKTTSPGVHSYHSNVPVKMKSKNWHPIRLPKRIDPANPPPELQKKQKIVAFGKRKKEATEPSIDQMTQDPPPAQAPIVTSFLAAHQSHAQSDFDVLDQGFSSSRSNISQRRRDSSQHDTRVQSSSQANNLVRGPLYQQQQQQEQRVNAILTSSDSSDDSSPVQLPQKEIDKICKMQGLKHSEGWAMELARPSKVDVEDQNEQYINDLTRKTFKSLVAIETEDGLVSSGQTNLDSLRLALDAKGSSPFVDSELFSLFQQRIRNLEDGMDEEQYMKQREKQLFGILPEDFFSQKYKNASNDNLRKLYQSLNLDKQAALFDSEFRAPMVFPRRKLPGQQSFEDAFDEAQRSHTIFKGDTEIEMLGGRTSEQARLFESLGLNSSTKQGAAVQIGTANIRNLVGKSLQKSFYQNLRKRRAKNQGLMQCLVFDPDSIFYGFWNVIMSLFCIMTALQYPYCIAFGFPIDWTERRMVSLIIGEIIMLINMVLNFFLAFKEEGEVLQRDVNLIQLKYLKGRFTLDLIVLLPFGYLSNMDPSVEYLKILWMIKVVRIEKLFTILDHKTFNPIFRRMQDKRTQRILEDEAKRDDTLVDHIKVRRILYLTNCTRLFKLVIQVLILAFYAAITWYFFVEFQEVFFEFDNDIEKHHTFFSLHGFREDESSLFLMTKTTYYVLTTLATVGFGDLYPTNEFEYACCVLIMFLGVTAFSFYMSQLNGMLHHLRMLDADNVDQESLTAFIMQLRRFNYGNALPDGLENQIFDFFNFKWATDRNQCVQMEHEYMLLTQLPQEVQIEIFRKFIFADFLLQFRRFFRFRKHRNIVEDISVKEVGKTIFHRAATMEVKKPKWIKFLGYPFYDWDNHHYQFFMISLLRSLETRRFGAREIIFRELEECSEFYFIQKGRYDIGYEINKVAKYRLQFGARTLIGAFSVVFNKRHFFLYRAHSEVEGFAVRKKNWDKLSKEFGLFSEAMKINIMYNYNSHIRKPLMKKKEKDVAFAERRNDYDQILVLSNLSQREMNKLKIEAFRKIQSKRNCSSEELIYARILNDQLSHLEDLAMAFITKQQEAAEAVIRDKYNSEDFGWVVDPKDLLKSRSFMSQTSWLRVTSVSFNKMKRAMEAKGEKPKTEVRRRRFHQLKTAKSIIW